MMHYGLISWMQHLGDGEIGDTFIQQHFGKTNRVRHLEILHKNPAMDTLPYLRMKAFL
jgi:hypothetical protein